MGNGGTDGDIYRAAIDAFTQSLALDSMGAVSFFNRGNCWHQLSQQARREKEEAIEKESKEQAYTDWLQAISLLRLEDETEARKMLGYVVDQKIQQRIREELGLGRKTKGSSSPISLRTYFYHMHKHLGSTWMNLRKYQEAAKAFERAMGANPEAAAFDDMLHGELGRALEQLAFMRYMQCFQLEDWILLKQAQDVILRAVSAYTTAAQIRPTNATHWFNLGNALVLLGKIMHVYGEDAEAKAYWQQAATAYATAIRIHSDYASAYFNLSNVYDLLGDRRLSEQHLARAERIRPGISKRSSSPVVDLDDLTERERAVMIEALYAKFRMRAIEDSPVDVLRKIINDTELRPIFLTSLGNVFERVWKGITCSSKDQYKQKFINDVLTEIEKIASSPIDESPVNVLVLTEDESFGGLLVATITYGSSRDPLLKNRIVVSGSISIESLNDFILKHAPADIIYLFLKTPKFDYIEHAAAKIREVKNIVDCVPVIVVIDDGDEAADLQWRKQRHEIEGFINYSGGSGKLGELVLGSLHAMIALLDENRRAAQHGSSSPAASRKLTVLMVEDDFETRRLLTIILNNKEDFSNTEFEITETFDGSEAVRVLTRPEPFDIIIVDLALPGTMDGNAVIVEALSMSSKQPYIIQMSACAFPHEEGSRYAHTFISKPFRINLFVQAVQEAIGFVKGMNAAGSSPVKILVAEDELTLKLLAQGLAKLNPAFDITVVSDGEEALTAFMAAKEQGEPFEIIITDDLMPKKHGYQLAQEARAISPLTFIILVSGATVKHVSEYKGIIDRFMPKPVSLRELLEVVNAYQPAIEDGVTSSSPVMSRRNFIGTMFAGVASANMLQGCVWQDDGATQRKATVFILDSGVDFSEVPGKVRGDKAGYVTSKNVFEYELSHGTVVAKSVREECRGCEIVSVNVSNDSGKIEAWAVVDALSDVLNYAINHPDEAIIVNMSLCHDEEFILEHLVIQALKSIGVVLVAASGNDNSNTLTYPAAYSEVIAVAGLTKNGRKAAYSNYGSYVDIAAQGSFSDMSGSLSISASGSSFAAPRVAGLIAEVFMRDK
ncbi:MAG: response regulator, partial [Candidatus Omnitrophica bacterium]|nr:response regulator [Candidatus Omnitrophota bacterium]